MSENSNFEREVKELARAFKFGPAGDVKPETGKTYDELLDWVKEESDELSGGVLVDEGAVGGREASMKNHPSAFNREKDDELFDLSTDYGVIAARGFAKDLLEKAEKAERKLDKGSYEEFIDELAKDLLEQGTFSAKRVAWVSQVIGKVRMRQFFECSFATFYEIVEGVRHGDYAVIQEAEAREALDYWLAING